MKQKAFNLIITLLSITTSQAADIKPLLEEGKAWRIGWANIMLSSEGTSRAQMEDYVVQAECRVKELAERGGEICRRVEIQILGSNDVSEEYILEKEGVVRLYNQNYIPGETPEIMKFTRLMDVNCQPGDSIIFNSEYTEAFGNPDFPLKYIIPTERKTILGQDGVDWTEIVFGECHSSWVEGIGASSEWAFFGGPFGLCSNYARILFMINCSLNGKQIFSHKDFSFPTPYGVLSPEFLTTGKSWTLSRGEKRFTITVDRDTVFTGATTRGLGCGIVGKVLKASDGKEYIVAEERGKLYAFFDLLGPAEPMLNAMPILDCTTGMFIRRADASTGKLTDAEYYWPGEHWVRGEIRQKVVGSRTFKEHIIVSSEDSTRVVASWVEGIGAPDSRCWATVLPEGEDVIRMINCRENGEVIFTAEDFSYPPASISEIKATPAESETVFDLQGRAVRNPRRGIFITPDGKKILR